MLKLIESNIIIIHLGGENAGIIYSTWNPNTTINPLGFTCVQAKTQKRGKKHEKGFTQSLSFFVFIVSTYACSKQQTISELTTSTAISELSTSTTTPKLDPYVINRARMFAAALATNDIELITKMVEFPLKVNYQNGSTQVISKSNFMNIYNMIFTSGFITTYGLADLGNNVVITSNGGISLTEGDYAIIHEWVRNGH